MKKLTIFFIFVILISLVNGSITGDVYIKYGYGEFNITDYIKGTIYLTDHSIRTYDIFEYAVCGNGVQESGEDCDGSDLNGKSCVTQGFASGTLTCTASCTFNTNNCILGSTGGGSSSGGSTYPQCQDGKITYTCYCQSVRHTEGWCLDDVWYGEEPDIEIEEPPVIESETVDDYNFTIYSDKYAYELKENFDIIVNTYRNNDLVNADSVYVRIYDFDIVKEERELTRTDTGTYILQYINQLKEGTYNFEFSVRFGSRIITQSKIIKITKNSEIENIIREPTGKVRSWIYIILILLISLIFIFIVIIRKKKDKRRKERNG